MKTSNLNPQISNIRSGRFTAQHGIIQFNLRGANRSVAVRLRVLTFAWVNRAGRLVAHPGWHTLN
jgi:hypothetical protein